MSEVVIRKLEQFEHFGFKWIAAGSGGFHHWVTDSKSDEQPEFMTCGLCCFHLPIVAGIETGRLSKDEAGDLIVSQMKSGISGGEPDAWFQGKLTKKGMFSSTPSRGDIVFFSAKEAKYFAHVAVATGNDDEIITFGHDAPYLQGGKHTLLVERKTIDDVKSLNRLLTDVHYCSPSW
ncbi:hypothetical protein [Vibrio marisflavi]|uniref:NlpC/P60 domain-containing protein n=1 Tax=Vibrio marisflavi CECT 7928 TaxID=634439 RepID=A0ABN8E812_9VIBR|nr:hypothetical protein [Vibrio marisflavi]CAH0540747.1 hypothetical protein VMF7928_03088 [Vibrio marisflavi CECT 7928]